MRELRGVVIDETEPGAAGSDDAMPVEVARATLRAAVEQQMREAIRFHETITEVRGSAASVSTDFNHAAPHVEPNHAAICVPTGVGKSEAARAGLASYVREAKRRRVPHRAVVTVPTHKLGEEARQRMPADITTALLQSRKANDLATGEPLCLNLAAVKAAEAIGADVERTACRKPRRGGDPILCRFYDRCGYQAQKAAAKNADIVYCAHQYLSGPPKELTRNVGVVVIDESFWQSGLSFSKIAIDGLGAELKSFPVRDHDDGERNDIDTAHLASLIERLQQAVDLLPEGEYVTKAALLAAGLLPGDECGSGAGAVAKKLEWRRKVHVDLSPDSSEETITARAAEYGFLGQLPKRAAMWQAVEELLSGADDATGRLRTEIKTTKDGSVLYLKLNGRHDIHPRIAELPVMVLDATLNIDIVKYFFPRIELALDLKVEAPHEQIMQVTGLPVGKSSLSQLEPGKRRPEEERRVANKRDRLLKVVRKLVAGRRCVVITNKELEPMFDGAGSNIEVAHFNAIEGIDRWRDVECLITIGRPLPSPKAVEDMAAALTGKPVLLPLYAASRPGGRPQKMIIQDRAIRLKSGVEVTLPCRVFELPEAELIRRAVTEAAVVQAVGRARGVNRSADNPGGGVDDP